MLPVAFCESRDVSAHPHHEINVFGVQDVYDIFCVCKPMVKDEDRFLLSIWVDFTSEAMYFDAELLDDLIMTFMGHLSYLLAAINPVENRDRTIAERHGSNNRFESTEQVGLINEDKRMFLCFRFREALKQGPHPRFLRRIYRKRHFKETQHPFLLRLFVFHIYQKSGSDFIDAQRFRP